MHLKLCKIGNQETLDFVRRMAKFVICGDDLLPYRVIHIFICSHAGYWITQM